MNTGIGKIVVLVVAVFFSAAVMAQSKEQKALEEKRNEILSQINELQRLLNKQGTERKSVSSEMEGINKKILMTEQLTKVTNQQINLLNSKIGENQKNIEKLTTELGVLKEDYAEMIRKSYKTRSQQNRLMFVLSSESFFQAVKRMEYMRQFREHLKKQGAAILQKSEALKNLNEELVTQRQSKEKLIEENRDSKAKLEADRLQQQELIAQIKKKESGYIAQIKDKQKAAKDLEREIQRMIEEAIAESRKKAQAAGVPVTKAKEGFALTPEEEMIAENFAANKGRLIWPVERGVVSVGYGIHTDPVYPDLVQESNGVTILTEEGTNARAVFEGVVLNIAINNGKANVYVRHGNYITTYCNLDNLYVKKGDKVKAKQALGKIFTNRITGKTELKFLIYKNTEKLNPELWVYKM